MTLTWILAGLSASCWLLFLYPYAGYPLLLKQLGKRPIAPRPTDLSVSLLFCVHNESACLPDKIDNLWELKRRCPDLEILVYDDASSDGSHELLASASDLLTVVRGPGRTGKAAGMKRLAARASGSLLVFTDANIMLSPDAIERLLPYYGDPAVGGVCCTIKTTAQGDSATSSVGSSYVGTDDRLRDLESDTGNVMGASGGLFSVRRRLYPEFPDSVQDDFTVSMSVIFQGKRLVRAPDVVGYEKAAAQRNEEIRRRIRIGARAFHTHRFLWPQLKQMTSRDRVKYASRKILRWFGGVFLGLGTLFGLAAVATISTTACLTLAAAGIVVVAISLRTSSGVLAKVGEMGLATFATLVGVVQGMRGRTMATWAPAKSR